LRQILPASRSAALQFVFVVPMQALVAIPLAKSPRSLAEGFPPALHGQIVSEGASERSRWRQDCG